MKVSDLTVLEGCHRGNRGTHLRDRPVSARGITFRDDWDNIGRRLAESGSVTIEHVRVAWASAAVYVDREPDFDVGLERLGAADRAAELIA
jgi:hypothetical protein